jgi:hypothetical protein
MRGLDHLLGSDLRVGPSSDVYRVSEFLRCARSYFVVAFAFDLLNPHTADLLDIVSDGSD